MSATVPVTGGAGRGEALAAMAADIASAAFAPLPADDSRQRCPEIVQARATLGRAAGIPLAEGLRATDPDAPFPEVV